MARRIRWQILIAAVSSVLVLGLMAYLAVTTAAVPRPLSGGAYVEGLIGIPQQLNPLVSDPARDPVAADIRALLFDGLMKIGPDGLPEPALAESWEVDDSGVVYTFTLRNDVVWHDGAPLTVDDALFTLRAIQNRGFAGDPSISAIWRDVLFERVGERSIRCRLAAPFAPFLSLATFPILPAHLLGNLQPEQWASAPYSLKPIGTGPYQLTEITGEHALLDANPRYFGGRPFVESIELRFFANPQAERSALNRGEIQGLGFMGTSDLSQLNLPRGFTRHALPLDSAVQLAFNLRSGPLADTGLRRALAEGLDKNELIKRTLDGQASPLDTPILPGWWAASPKIVWYPADQQHAGEVLTSLGYTPGSDGVRARDGKPLVLPLITSGEADRVAVANEIARQWGQLGVQVQVETLEADALRQRLAAHDFTLALYGLQRLGADPDVYEQWHSSQAERGNNYAGLQDEQIDELLFNARRDLDIGVRAPSYEAFQRRWVELVPSIMLYQPLFVYVATSDLEGLGFDRPAIAIVREGGAAEVSENHLLVGREGRFRNVVHWFIRSAREIHGELR
ncbi:MAG TPA: peptide ABC transporter substrate-binding protein [Roseiflexaceae bacterium]|nr:peptide ABC transporter substrate-binding protein [Roseiflexaceae bacterium]